MQYGRVAGTAIEPFLKSFDPEGSSRMVAELYQPVPTLDAGLKKIMTDPDTHLFGHLPGERFE